MPKKAKYQVKFFRTMGSDSAYKTERYSNKKKADKEISQALRGHKAAAVRVAKIGESGYALGDK